jgi:hypothetical protein
MKAPQENRIFLELANNEVTPEWVAEKYNASGVEQLSFEKISQSIIEVQKEIRKALNFLDEGLFVNKTIFPLLFAFEKEPLFSKTEHLDLDGNPIIHLISDNKIAEVLRRRGLKPDKKYSFLAAEAAQDFLSFLENDIEKLRRCLYPPCRKFYLYNRSDQMFCNKRCGDNSRRLRDVTSGKAAEKQRRYRERKKQIPVTITLSENRLLKKTAENFGARNHSCQYYGDCLREAAGRNWLDFSCEECLQKQ